jgi:hypothetical protein
MIIITNSFLQNCFIIYNEVIVYEKWNNGTKINLLNSHVKTVPIHYISATLKRPLRANQICLARRNIFRNLSAALRG